MNKRLGYVVFVISAGIVDEMSLKLYEDETAAVNRALEIIQARWEDDRFANPDHRLYSSGTKVINDEVTEEYERRRQAVWELQSVDLDDETDLVIRPVTEA